MQLSLQELAALREANARKSTSLFAHMERKEELEKQFKTGNLIEHKVVILKFGNISHIEFWQEVKKRKNGKPVYYLRDTDESCWYKYKRPFGSKEPGQRVGDNVIFVICNSDPGKDLEFYSSTPNGRYGEPLFASSNLDGADFPTFVQLAHDAWRQISADHPHFDVDEEAHYRSEESGEGTGIASELWILSFMDPVKYKEELKEELTWFKRCEEIWISMLKEVSRESIGRFNYMGTDWYILKILYEHPICHKNIIKYVASDSLILQKPFCSQHILADYFEGEPGPMYFPKARLSLLRKGLL